MDVRIPQPAMRGIPGMGAFRNYGDCRRIKLQLCQMHIGIAGKKFAADKAGALSYGDKVDVSAFP